MLDGEVSIATHSVYIYIYVFNHMFACKKSVNRSLAIELAYVNEEMVILEKKDGENWLVSEKRELALQVSECQRNAQLVAVKQGCWSFIMATHSSSPQHSCGGGGYSIF